MFVRSFRIIDARKLYSGDNLLGKCTAVFKSEAMVIYMLLLVGHLFIFLSEGKLLLVEYGWRKGSSLVFWILKG